MSLPAQGRVSTRSAAPSTHLAREIGLVGLVATALCAMVGVGINIIPFMIQRSQPGIGAMVPAAFLVAVVPASLAALCYAMLSSSMPRAGGNYVFATRALNPFLGFLGSFAQWFGLSMGMGVVAYLLVPMLRDTLSAAGWAHWAPWFDLMPVRISLALAAIWTFWAVNTAGIKTYERTVVVMAVAMIVGPVVMTITGFAQSSETFYDVLAANGTLLPPDTPLPAFTWGRFFGAAVILFSSFIGFDAVVQAGGEAENPSRDMPRSIIIAIVAVAVYYVLFSASVYNAVPWEHIYRVSLVQDVSAPALLAPLMPWWLSVIILSSVTIAILNSIPAVMLANSRLIYAFATDRIFPKAFARLHPRHRTPYHAITLTAIAGSVSVLGCAFAGDFFLGVDLLVVSMLVNFLLIACAVISFPQVNPELHARISFIPSRGRQMAIAVAAAALLLALLVVQVFGDLTSATPWFMKSTVAWLVAMGIGSFVFARFWMKLRNAGIDPRAEIFGQMPRE
jgi:APA family basic amino acid/polyamine antiporter